MTPREAIKNECKYCLNIENMRKLPDCDSKICELNNTKKTHLKRIKAHCLSCVPEQSWQAVRACLGEVITSEGKRACPLHIFRRGKNPKRKGRDMKDMKCFRFVPAEKVV
jgi:hypothetical protein